MQYFGQYHQEQENLSITLNNRDLWTQFQTLTNEMIVTKVGRRMFPIISIDIRGLDPEKMYTVELSFDQIDSHRWRYVSCQWQAGIKPDPATRRSSYQHPDSPNYGRTWMKDTILFSKVKLTNKNDHTGASQVILNSLHKYKPKISIIDVMLKQTIYETSFDETEFIAVTAYQNEEVKSLKIRYNPFAKAFLESDNIKREMADEQTNHVSVFNSRESSSGGPERLQLRSYRASPYNYSQTQRRSSPPTNVVSYPSSSSTSPFDLSTFYNPTASTSHPCSSSSLLVPDNTAAYYSNSYYSSPSSYYFPYGTSQSPVSHYPFIAPLNYPLYNSPNQETTSFLHNLQPMTILSNSNNHSTSSSPIQTNMGQY